MSISGHVYILGKNGLTCLQKESSITTEQVITIVTLEKKDEQS